MASQKRMGLALLLLVSGCKVNTATNIQVRLINHPPTIESAAYSLNRGNSRNIVLDVNDADDHELSYTFVTRPRFGTLTGTPPNLTYTPWPYFYGTDSFSVKVSDYQLSSSVATISITVNRTTASDILYLDPAGDDLTAVPNNSTKPFHTAQAAYEAADALAATDYVHVFVRPGPYTGIVLQGDWNPRVIFHGSDATTTLLGGIQGNGVGESSGVAGKGASGWDIDVSGWNIDFGSISSQGAPSYADPDDVGPVTGYTGGDGGVVSLAAGVVARVINVSGGGGLLTDPAGGDAGKVVVRAGARSQEIYANGGQGETGGSAYPTVGYTVDVEGANENIAAGIVGTIVAEGGRAQSAGNPGDGGGRGGRVQILGTAGHILVRGGSDEGDGEGGDGGEVTVGTAATALNIFTSGARGLASGGSGGDVSINGARVGNIFASGASARDRSTDGLGGDGGNGGNVDVDGVAGTIVANGGAGGDGFFEYADPLDPGNPPADANHGGNGGNAGSVTLQIGAQVGTITLRGGAGADALGADNLGDGGNGGDGGDVSVTSPATYGTTSLTGGSAGTGATDGVAGSNGVVAVSN